MDFVLYGIPAAVVIVAVVEMLKRLFNIEGRWLVLAAVVTGILLAVLSQLAIQDPSFDTWFRTILGGLMAGLIAAGIYDATLQKYPKDSA